VTKPKRRVTIIKAVVDDDNGKTAVIIDENETCYRVRIEGTDLPDRDACKWFHKSRLEEIIEDDGDENEDVDPPCRPDGGRDGSGMLM
jgi:hypothetical protein